jgi:hypothetical protein
LESEHELTEEERSAIREGKKKANCHTPSLVPSIDLTHPPPLFLAKDEVGFGVVDGKDIGENQAETHADMTSLETIQKAFRAKLKIFLVRIKPFVQAVNDIDASDNGVSLSDYFKQQQAKLEPHLVSIDSFIATEIAFVLELKDNPERIKIVIEQFFVMDNQKSAKTSPCKSFCCILTDALSFLLRDVQPAYIKQIQANSKLDQDMIATLSISDLLKLIWVLKLCKASNILINELELAVNNRKPATLDDKIIQLVQKEISSQSFLEYIANKASVIQLKAKLRSGNLPDEAKALIQDVVDRKKKGGVITSNVLLNNINFTGEEFLNNTEQDLLRDFESLSTAEQESIRNSKLPLTTAEKESIRNFTPDKPNEKQEEEVVDPSKIIYKNLLNKLERCRELLRVSLQETWRNIIDPIQIKVLEIKRCAVMIHMKSQDTRLKQKDNEKRSEELENIMKVFTKTFMKKIQNVKLNEQLQMSFDEIKAEVRMLKNKWM